MAFTTTSQTQSTFVSNSPPTQYDVFLSFRGEDTRLNFTGHLYQRLHDHGIKTFKDEPELRGGEVISDALLDGIRKSKTYIVVLSENYASSSWCLDELAEILRCKKTMQRLVLPVFYNILPAVVRHQTGSFEQAFTKHEFRFAVEKVINWKITLKEVADFLGYHISKNRSEADVISEIVDELLLKINPKSLHVTKYPVGLDSRVKAITTLLSSGTDGVIKFGIYGMGGVGKTTLAKALYNQLLGGRSFKGSCFLANVRDISGTAKGLVSLQQQLIDDLLNSTTKFKVHNVDQGINYIRERISSAKVLVLIDDIYDLEQYESLAGPFASGSVVIITTRDEEMLDKVNVEPKYRYMLKVLDDAQSRELFTKYAFKKAEPPNNLLALYDDILGLAGGLPLALQVFGSHLSTKKEAGWESYIEALQQHPNSTIEQKLVISLNTLESDDRTLKKIFVDIACFFVGWNKEQAIKVLETYCSHADDKVDTLKKRCLLTIDGENLEMHDLLRDVGRNVARNNAPDEPEKYSRLWLPEDIRDVLRNHKGTEAIEGIIPYNFYREDAIEGLYLAFLDARPYTLYRADAVEKVYQAFLDASGKAIEGESLSTETFKWMSKLRFLYLKNVNVTGSFKQIFEDLRVLRWKWCPLKCLPCDFYPKKLVILELPRSNMRTMWDLNMVPHVFGKLKTLNMSHSQDLITTPDFTTLPSLETLILEGCKSLEEVHMSIGSLAWLVFLDLHGCAKLRSFPDSICNLRALQVLTISECESLDALPIQLGNIESLTKLNAEALNVSKLPDSIGHLPKLVELNVSNNNYLKTLPDTICNLRSLEILDIDRCISMEALPREIGDIESLEEIDARGLPILKLPDSIGRLTKLVKLDLSNYKKLKTLPDTICDLTSLEILSIKGCEELEILPDQMWKITSLRKLNASNAYRLEKLPDIGPNLQELDISYCHHLLSVPKLPPNLTLLRAYHCESLERLPNLSNLKHLETLELTKCRGLIEIPGLEKLTALTLLHLSDKQGRDIDFRCGWTNCLLTKPLFQVYSEFGHQISVYAPRSHWLMESPYWTSGSSESTAVYAHLLPNESHNFMGLILCFEFEHFVPEFHYSVKNTTSGFIWTDSLRVPPMADSLMLLLPKSFFSVCDDDHRIEFTSDVVKIVGIHLLYKTETEMIQDVVQKHVIEIDAIKDVDPALHDIILDIACFFIRWKKIEAVSVLETYYSNAGHYIDILQEKCLLTINDSDELEMTDLHQHIGRVFARNSSPDEPGKHSRLWLSVDIYDVLKKHTGTEAIEGIIPPKLMYKDALEGKSFTTETFKMMSRLRYLHLNKVNLTGSFDKIFEDLRWLCWDHCPLICLPSDFYLPKLVILELPNSNMRTMWELNMVSHVFEKLKTLNMSFSQDLTSTGDLTRLPCLEIITLEGCISLEEVHISIGSLVRLVTLNLVGCIKLKTLPQAICNLRALEGLDIFGCISLEALPTALGNMKSLRELYAEKLTVSKLPDSIGHLSKLVKLNLSGNKNLETLPDTICNLRSLELLDISRCDKLKILPNLSNLKQLQKLFLMECSGLTVVLGLEELTALEVLHLTGCNSSFLANIFTKSFFQKCCELGHPIQIYTFSAEFPEWIIQTSNLETTMSLDLPPDVSRGFLGMILCFEYGGNGRHHSTYYSVKNTMSEFIWSGNYEIYDGESLMVIVPSSIFSVRNGDDRIELTTKNAEIFGIHLLYKTEIVMIEKYDSTAAVNDDGNMEEAFQY